MKKMTGILLIISMLVMAGCSTMGLSTTATVAEKRAALCQDAQMGFALSQAMLEGVLAPEAMKYWVAYKAGASLALQTYCPAL
jgi:hypothetical protein